MATWLKHVNVFQAGLQVCFFSKSYVKLGCGRIIDPALLTDVYKYNLSQVVFEERFVTYLLQHWLIIEVNCLLGDEQCGIMRCGIEYVQGYST